MPIRTNRGRAAVYRKLWGWPLRSPRHLGVAVFIAALVLTAAGIVVPKVIGTKATNQVSAGASSSAPTTTRPGQVPDQGVTSRPSTSPLPTRITSAPSPTTRETVSPQALEAVTKWAELWVDHPAGITGKDWLERLRPYTTEEYLGVMGTVDPANIKATKVTGPVRAETSYAKSVEAEVPTNDRPLHVTVIDTGQGWKVADYQEGSG
ncbi:hypothetical protein [Actinokineospora globicatena]|uniref:Uncharacterized protein n=1 Tax=Actinokineospora globicatena TaxID=103729 RepID=A0A9W6V7A7_9PSEU|nr:hypothetical protein [Actinokineospora globicatena]MCP2300348.1 hypothetical protein [Actinokineospora globicatena]GLW80876.1 hypothetical protein Aglo01_53570 [Actinokineospora globicatena]GLW88069.1 hypothetical protein Aglo02_57080 [Actinokineospora globicatena]GLW92555.1 hypothetical protein Aglo03_33710 [Actinokineospora globicatena]